MADAELEKTIAKINISTNNEELTAQGEVLKFEGFLKVYREDQDEEEVTEEESAGRHVATACVLGRTGFQGNEGHRKILPSRYPDIRKHPW